MGIVMSKNELLRELPKIREGPSFYDDLGLKKTIVLTNGCFDVLHRGHFETIRMAARQGTCLIVAVNTDESVRALKGPHRPIYPLADRMNNVSQIDGVSYVVPFGTAEDPSVESLVERIQPDVLVKGGDYTIGGVVGAAIVERHGGRVFIAPKVVGVSTTDTLKKLATEGTEETMSARYEKGKFIAMADSQPEQRGE